tara:strand:- start:24136 stop:25740 length:1605 start_codon:yes stop_codon:yes gene_type:complete
MGALDEHISALLGAPPDQRQIAIEQAQAATSSLLWVPNPGPQTTAYFSEADETLFGGEAGGGKSDLVIGLSLTEHQRSLVLRRTNAEAVKLFDRYEEIIGNRDGSNEQKGWKIGGRIIDIGGCQLEKDKQKRKGIPHDLKAFDELVDFSESQYTFIIGWCRSNDPGQRCRVVSTTNPPTRPEGMWVVRRWAAWLDPKHPNPAHDGELRWYTTVNGADTEVDGPGPHMIEGREVMAKSRTFIRSKLADNPNLTRTSAYAATLDALPKELRDAYREGKFDAGLKDAPFQAIPTAWIQAAMDRWTEKPRPGVPMCGMGVDCTGGGDDPMVISPRYDGWFDRLIIIPGADIPPERVGKHSAGLVLSHRRDKAIVVVDMGGGYGGALYEALHDNEISAVPHKGAESTSQRTKDGQYRFYNKRSQVIWRFREALDPDQVGGSPIELPPDPTLMADLAAPAFWVAKVEGQAAIQIEQKEAVCARIGRSTDRGDAVVMSWSAGPTYITDGDDWQRQLNQSRGYGQQGVANMGQRGIRLTGRR